MDGLEAVFRWVHVLAGIMWVGLLYYFNFVNGQMVAKLDTATKQKVLPELVPRALFFFRWGAAWTWVTGLFLLMIVYYHGRAAVESQTQQLTTMSYVMLGVTLIAFHAYDRIYRSRLGKNAKSAATISFVLLAAVVYCMVYLGHYSYRGMLIHTGVLFGTIMAFNVWFRIWPAQRMIITAVKKGEAPDPDQVALAGSRSRHNTYLSVPLFWAMLNQHLTYFSGGNLGLSRNWAWLLWLVIILVGWHVVYQLYRKANRIEGF